MNEKLDALCNLRTLSRTIEQDLGLSDLSAAELDILLAAQSLNTNPSDVLTSSDIRHHRLVQSFAPATFHRALRALIERGYLKKAEGAKAKSYVLVQMQA